MVRRCGTEQGLSFMQTKIQHADGWQRVALTVLLACGLVAGSTCIRAQERNSVSFPDFDDLMLPNGPLALPAQAPRPFQAPRQYQPPQQTPPQQQSQRSQSNQPQFGSQLFYGSQPSSSAIPQQPSSSDRRDNDRNWHTSGSTLPPSASSERFQNERFPNREGFLPFDQKQWPDTNSRSRSSSFNAAPVSQSRPQDNGSSFNGSSKASDFIERPQRSTEQFEPFGDAIQNDRINRSDFGSGRTSTDFRDARDQQNRSGRAGEFDPFRGPESGSGRINSSSEFSEQTEFNFDDRLRTREVESRMNILDADATQLSENSFRWNEKITSIADLWFSTATMFQHNDDFMTPQEEQAYVDLMIAVKRQKRLLMKQALERRNAGDDPTALWEEAFYSYPRARQLAWENGGLRKATEAPKLNGLLDPFRAPVETTATAVTADAPYRVLEDIARFPQDFVGRPIVLYGRFTANSEVRLQSGRRSATSELTESPRSDPDGFSEAEGQGEIGSRWSEQFGGIDETQLELSEQRLLRGTLTALEGSRPLAIVDTRGLITPSSGLQDISAAWRNEASIPVLIKGWVVKQWKDDRPLIYCESMRLITPRPHTDLITAHTIDKRRLRDEETWLYYETLSQLKLTSATLQQQIATTVQQLRIEQLMSEIVEKAEGDLQQLAKKQKTGSIDEQTFRRQKGSLQRRLNQRLDRYKQYRRSPEDFPTYVDLFQHPEQWHGQLVTLSGHVRHVVSYSGDAMLFGGQRLYELWLFTDDSQHNPAVIVTPNLPADFPTSADVVNRVTVTGCFFKRYVYGSQDTARIAPLILAQGIRWEPTVDQVQSLVADGHLSAGSPRAAQARALAGDTTSDTVILLVTFGVLMAMMIVWGRAQREERDRVRLRHVVNDVPVFEHPDIDGYSHALANYSSDPIDDLLSNQSGPQRRHEGVGRR